MRIPFRSLHMVPAHVCFAPSCVSTVLDDPIITRVGVNDAIGFEYAFDLQVTQGFYTLIVAFAAIRWVRGKVIEALQNRRSDQGGAP